MTFSTETSNRLVNGYIDTSTAFIDSMSNIHCNYTIFISISVSCNTGNYYNRFGETKLLFMATI